MWVTKQVVAIDLMKNKTKQNKTKKLEVSGYQQQIPLCLTEKRNSYTKYICMNTYDYN